MRSTPAEVVAVELGRSLAQREGAPPAALRRCSPSSTPASASRATPWRWVGAARGHRDLAGEGRADADAQRLSGRGGAGAKPALAADLIYPARGIADHGAWAVAEVAGHDGGGMSEQLAALCDAGLLTSYRVGHQVVYERTPLGIAVTGAADTISGR